MSDTSDEMKPDPSPEAASSAGREALDQVGSAPPEGQRVDHDDELHHDASRLSEEG